MRLNSLRGQGVVALEDHSLRHVTGSPPHSMLSGLEKRKLVSGHCLSKNAPEPLGEQWESACRFSVVSSSPRC